MHHDFSYINLYHNSLQLQKDYRMKRLSILIILCLGFAYSLFSQEEKGVSADDFNCRWITIPVNNLPDAQYIVKVFYQDGTIQYKKNVKL